MQDWNVVVTVTEGGFVKGIKFLEPLGEVSRTDYFNVLVMKAATEYKNRLIQVKGKRCP